MSGRTKYVVMTNEAKVKVRYVHPIATSCDSKVCMYLISHVYFLEKEKTDHLVSDIIYG